MVIRGMVYGIAMPTLLELHPKVCPAQSPVKRTQIPMMRGSRSRMAGASSKTSFDTGNCSCREGKELKQSLPELQLVGGLEHVLFFHTLGIITPIDYFFQRG